MLLAVILKFLLSTTGWRRGSVVRTSVFY